MLGRLAPVVGRWKPLVIMRSERSKNLHGIIEIKCPKSATHIQYLLDNKVPSKYIPQITHNLWITGAHWADFISFDPRLPEHLQLFICRVNAADLDLATYAEKACAFLAEVETLTNQLRDI
jgi:hypothetical protein